MAAQPCPGLWLRDFHRLARRSHRERVPGHSHANPDLRQELSSDLGQQVGHDFDLVVLGRGDVVGQLDCSWMLAVGDLSLR